MTHCPDGVKGLVQAERFKNQLHTTQETLKCPFTKQSVLIDDDVFASSSTSDTVTLTSCPFLELNLCLLILCQATVLFILAVPGCGVSYIITSVGFPLTVLTIVLSYHAYHTIKRLAKLERDQLVKKLVEHTLVKLRYWLSWVLSCVMCLIRCVKQWLKTKFRKLYKGGFERRILQVASKEQGNGDQLKHSPLSLPPDPNSLLPSQASEENPTRDEPCFEPLYKETNYEDIYDADDFGVGTSMFREGGSSSDDNIQEQHGHLVVNGVRPKLPRRPLYNPAMEALQDKDPPLPPPFLPPKLYYAESTVTVGCYLPAQVVDVEFANVNVEPFASDLVLEKNDHPPAIPQGELIPPFHPLPDNPLPHARVENLQRYILPFIGRYGPVFTPVVRYLPPGAIPREVGKAQANLAIIFIISSTCSIILHVSPIMHIL